MMSIIGNCLKVSERILCVQTIRFLSTHGGFMKSMHPDLKIPKVNLVELVMKDFGKWHNKIAIECAVTQKRYTFEELRTNSLTLGKSLRKVFRLKKGDVVGILLPNSSDYPVCVFAAILSSLTVTTINPLCTIDELERHLKDANVKIVFTHISYWNTTQQAIQKLKTKIPVVLIKTKESESIPDKAINYDELISMKVDLPHLIPIEDEHIAFLPYSSGTTGLPKGVMLTNYNLVANIAQYLGSEVSHVKDATKNYQELLPLIIPIYHTYGFTASMLVSLSIGCKLVAVPKFTSGIFFEVLERYQPTVLHLVPPLVALLTSHSSGRGKHFQRLRTIVCAGAPLRATDENRLRETIAKSVQIIQVYGMTETSPVCITPRLQQGQHLSSFGHPVSNTCIKVVNPDDPTLKHLGPNQLGELLIKGPQVMKGYHNKPEETKHAFSDGWYWSGDIVKYDNDNMFYISDRIKELIKVKGFQVAPAELEGIIRDFPGVSEAAVIGIPHEYMGESPRAYIVQKSGEKVDIQRLMEYVQSKVCKYKKIVGGVAIIDRIPKNPSGKILRRELRSLYQEHGV